jgi:hypothetical protein
MVKAAFVVAMYETRKPCSGMQAAWVHATNDAWAAMPALMRGPTG